MRTPIPDIDVIYFDSSNTNELEEKKIENKLKVLVPKIPWSVKNQARMHVINNMEPYFSSIDGISKFPETVTALGVKLDDQENVILTAPWGITDVVNLEDIHGWQKCNAENWREFAIYIDIIKLNCWNGQTQFVN